MAKIKAGTYRFNDDLTAPEKGGYRLNFPFTCNINLPTEVAAATGFDSFVGRFTTIEIYGRWQASGAYLGCDIMYTLGSSDPDVSPALSLVGWTLPCDIQVSVPDNVWNAAGLLGTGYQTITIPYDQDVDDAFEPWFTANTVKQGGNAVTVEYNGSVIAAIEGGKAASIACKDKLMRTDMVITVPEMGGEDVPEWDGSYTISGGTISFTITYGSTIETYEAEENMTWEQWCESEYNTGGYYVSNGNVYRSGGKAYLSDIKGTDVITSRDYNVWTSTSGGQSGGSSN